MIQAARSMSAHETPILEINERKRKADEMEAGWKTFEDVHNSGQLACC